MRTKRIKLYKFSELSEDAKNRAIADHVNFLTTCIDLEDTVYGAAVEEMERMQTPWFLGQTLFHDYRDNIIEDIECNNYEFTQDGKLFN